MNPNTSSDRGTQADPDTVPSCESCAACCFGNGDRYVPVTGDDHARLAASAGQWTRFIGNRCYMRMTDGHCAALRPVPGTDRMICGIYHQRPQVCRDLERGSPACAAARLGKAGAARN